MTKVSGNAKKTSAKPNNSGFSAITPAPAAPILDCAIPVPSAPNPKAIPAPIGIIGSTILPTPHFIRFYQLRFFTRSNGKSADALMTATSNLPSLMR
jgi:hypothetical protein